MNALALMATLGLDSSEYEKGLGKARKDAGGFAKLAKKVITGVAVAKATSAAVKGIVSITKAAVEAYASYEQLVGGVETLFGTSAKSFEDYAENASDSMYKMGQRGDDIKKLQKELIAAGYDIGESGADGIYGPKTKAAFDAYAKAGGQLVKDLWESSNSAKDVVLKNAQDAYMTAGLDMNTYMETVTSFSAALLQSLGNDTVAAAGYADMAIRDMSDNANKMGTNIDSIISAYMGFSKQNYTMLDNLKLGYGGTKTEMERLIKDAEKLDNSFIASRNANGELTMSFGDIVQAIHIVQDNMGITGTTAEEAEKTITGSLNSMKAAWTNLLIAFGTGDDNEISRTMNALVETATTFVGNIVPIIENALMGIAQFISGIAPVIAEEVPELIRETLPVLLRALGTLVSELVAALPELLVAVWDALKEVENELAEFIKQAIKNIFGFDIDTENIKAALESIRNAILAYEAVSKITAIINGLTNAFAALKAGGLLAIASNPIALAIGAVTLAITYLWNTSEGFREVVSYIWDSIKEAIVVVTDAIKSGIDAAKEAIQKFWDKTEWLRDGIGAIWESISNTTKEWWDKITGWIQPAIDGVLEFLKLLGIVESNNVSVGSGGGRYTRGKYGITIPDTLGGQVGSGGGRKHATAMENGEILRGITPFGIDRRGTVHYGGEAGDEAVIGVSSLRQMVQEAAMNAVRHINVQLVLDNGVLVAEMAPLLNDELNDIADWNGGGHA